MINALGHTEGAKRGKELTRVPILTARARSWLRQPLWPTRRKNGQLLAVHF